MSSKKDTDALQDDIVISGVSGKLPESSNIEEFKQNLLNGIDMVTNDPRRWEAGIYGLPERMAKMKDEDLEKFDDKFFGVHQKQGEVMDPCMRMLLELTHEAIIDAGINPTTLRGTRTGVYVGLSFVETEHEIPAMEPSRINGYCLTGCARAMFANRISYTFDFKGPSFVVDTACSSSLVALSHAFADIRAGRSDYAIVAGVNLILKPIFALQFLRLGIVSDDGSCKTFDAGANGYARADTCAVVFLQRSKDAKRIYASLLNVRTNTDGFKEQGVTFPDGRMQYKLLEETYGEIGMNPNDVVYVEAHGSGTPVGDNQEANMITDFFCKNRKQPLLIGSVKSNMGHAEPASGVSALAKMIIAMEEGIIPGDLHFKQPNPEVQGLLDGRLKVIDRNTKWHGGIIGLNSFGFGGANAHVILKSNPKQKSTTIASVVTPPKAVLCSGRTAEAVQMLLDHATANRKDDDLLALINNIHAQPIPLHEYRGYVILDEKEGALKQEVLEFNEEKRPIWFVYAGMGSQWGSMARELMQLEVFNKSIQNSAKVLSTVDIDLIEVLTRSTESTFDNMLYSFISIAAVQVALTDLLKALEIKPDGIIGHSAGELGAAYMDGCLTAEQTVLAAYWRGKSVLETPELPKGRMAAVGLSWDEVCKRLPGDCYAVCHNSADNCTVSGLTASMDLLLTQLNSEGVFARVVGSGGYAFHSKYIAGAAPMLHKNLARIIPQPKQRSNVWLSTSVPESSWQTPQAKLASADYFINNLISPVLFYEAIQYIPKNAIIVEIAPHGLFRSILRTLGPDVSYVSLMERKHKNNAEFLLSNIGKFYAAGGQPQVLKLSPPVSYPVARGTPMLNSVIGWDHSQKWTYPKFKNGRQSGHTVVEFDLSKEEDAYLTGHTVDGRILFPATGYMTLAWMAYAQQHGLDYLKTPIIMEDIVFHRATILNRDAVAKLGINFFQGNGTFEICEGKSLAVSGKIKIPENILNEELHLKPPCSSTINCKQLLTKDIYKELRLRGYDYGGLFQGLINSDALATTGHLQWVENWISFMDTMLQFRILSNDIRELYVPTSISRAVINPVKHLEEICKLAKAQQIEVGLPVHWYKKISVIKSGGIEIHKMKTAQTQRRPGAQSKPILERYVFVPNTSHSAGAQERPETKQEAALTVAMQLIIENSCSAVKLKGVEIENGRNPETLVAPKLLRLIEDEPILVGDVAIATIDNNNLGSVADALTEAGVRVIVKSIRKEPVEQNCHFLYAADLLANSDIETLEHSIATIKENGFLILEESISSYKEDWRLLLDKYHLGTVLVQPYNSQRVLLVVRRAVDLGQRNAVIVHVTEKNFAWLDKLKAKLTTAIENNHFVYVISQGEAQFGALGLMTCLKTENGGNMARLVYIQDDAAEKFSLDSEFYMKQLSLDLVVNVLGKSKTWGTFRHLKLEGQQPMLQVEQAYINTLTKGDLSSLKWIESPRESGKHNQNLERCTVYYAPLNFRDIMLASGKLGVDALPGDLAQQDCVLGLEFAGRDSSGRRIMSMVPAKSLATNCLANKWLMWRIPDNWTMEQASTVPCVYATVYYALVIRGQMRKGERILIHAGSGGVGQAAISVALHHGLTVFTTVGSKEKREFLKQRFPTLNDEHIGNSRDTSFEQLVMSETNGEGVEIVLNSLAEEKLQASIRCLAVNGRFLEIGKFDLSNNSPLGMSVFLKNTSFHGILLDSVMEGEESIQRQVASLVAEGIKSGAVLPLPTTIYTDKQVEQAFRFMASGRHIGKVVIKVRDEETTTDRSTAVLPKPHLINAIPRTYMHPEKCYVIIGGLGGFGLELTNWLVTRGARFIVINSHSGIKTGYQALMVRRWQTRGVNVSVDINDVTTPHGCTKLLEHSNMLAPIGGIFNLAAVLNDGLFEDQTVADFEKVTAPKVQATKYLDQYSRMQCTQLDYFVCFSSISCGRGNIGQTNYGLANSAMERICEQRQTNGFPGIAIQWGAIGDTGLVIEHMGGNDTVVGGTLPQRMASCLETFDLFLQQPHPVLASMVIAEKRKSDNSNKVSLIAAIANIMGLRDVKNVQDKTTLFDLGMDSLMSTEIKQTLERHFDLMLSAQEIRLLTFGALKQIDNDAANSKAVITPTANSQNVITSNGPVPQDKTQVVFTNEVLPKTVLVRLKSKAPVASKQKPVFFFAPIEGFATTLEPLAARLACPVYGLQCTEEVPLESYEACANFYLAHIRKVQPQGPYNILGYSFGCLLAHAIGLQLETSKEHVKILMLDGAPTLASSYVQTAKKQTDDLNKQQAMTLAYFGAMLADIDYHSMLSKLTELPTWENKLAQLAETLSSSTKQSSEVIKKAACMFKQKLLLSESYTSEAKLQGTVILIKSQENNAIMCEDYNLRKICSNLIDIKVINGSHRSILKEPQSLQIIEDILKTKFIQ